MKPLGRGGGHANVRSLNKYGVILLEEMMKRGMIIDVDHMSEKSTDAALDLVEKKPISGHHFPFLVPRLAIQLRGRIQPPERQF